MISPTSSSGSKSVDLDELGWISLEEHCREAIEKEEQEAWEDQRIGHVAQLVLKNEQWRKKGISFRALPSGSCIVQAPDIRAVCKALSAWKKEAKSQAHTVDNRERLQDLKAMGSFASDLKSESKYAEFGLTNRVYVYAGQEGVIQGALWLKQDKKKITVLVLATSPKVFNQGIGSALMHHVETIADTGARIQLTALKSAHEFYGRLGFCYDVSLYAASYGKHLYLVKQT